MKKQLLLLILMMLPLIASAHDIEVKNADGVTIYYNYTNDGTELAVTFRGDRFNTYPNRYMGNVVIPDEVTFMNRTRKVTSIGNDTFRGCSDLTSITIPNSITNIGDCSFNGCHGLTSITIPNCVKIIGNNAFNYCSGLISVTIENGVKWIGQYAFQDCRGLTSVTIPNSVTNIGSCAFENCRGLTSVTIPNSVTSIESGTFEGCSGLTFINIPNSVKSIGYQAFYKCTGLSSVTIPNSVTGIGERAFDGVDYPTIISLGEKPCGINGKSSSYRSFSLNTFNNATLYVPMGTIEKYKATEGWKDFLFIKEGTGGDEGATLEKCINPIISYNNGKLTYYCETEGATCQSTITDTDIKSYSGNVVQLAVTYNISVYATKPGFENSETVTATLCWIDKEPTTEGITDGLTQIPSKAVLIQNISGTLNLQGVEDGILVNVYEISGKLAGSTISRNGQAQVNTSLQAGNVAIIKIGEKSIKVIIQ